MPTNSPTPLSLLQRLSEEDDAAAWQQFLDHYTPWLDQALRRLNVRPQEFDDLKQEVLAVMVREMERFVHNGREGAFRAWLKQLVLNRVRTFRRAPRHAEASTAVVDFAESINSLERYWDEEHDRFVVRRMLARIQGDFAESTWRAFQRQVLEEQPAAVVASELGLSVNAVLLAKSRILKRLRAELDGLIDS